MDPSLSLPADHLITDAEARAWVAATRRAAADGTLLVQSSTKDEILRHREEVRKQLAR